MHMRLRLPAPDMNLHTAKTLEWNKVLDQLACFTKTPAGTARIRALAPRTQFEDIRVQVDQIRELILLLEQGRTIPLDTLPDVRPALAGTGREDAVLAFEELRALLLFLDQIGPIRAFIDEHEPQAWPAVADLIEPLQPCHDLRRALDRTFDEDGQVADTASPELGDIRRALRQLRVRIQQMYDRLLQDPNLAPHLQDQFVTIRNGRYVIPVRTEAQGRVPGLIHDRSDSGQTVFIEPMHMVEIANQISDLAAQERVELHRIQRALSLLARNDRPALLLDHELLTQLDFVWAAARFGFAGRMSAPEFNKAHRVRLVQARHPLLQHTLAALDPPQEIVPLDLEIGDDFRILVITGSNTGGKTVALKTIGLLCMMAQAGLPVPVGPESTFPFFDRILVDVGDEQSIEQSLSTFSGHLRQIRSILMSATDRSLVLLDELGAGTDPREGGAIACAILSHLRDIGAATLATTHLGQVKIFVHENPDMQNAAVEFDPKTLQPTYRLVIGQPGSSHAISIARRLDLPEAVLDYAASFIEEESANLEHMLLDMNAARVKLQQEVAEASAIRTESATLKEQLKTEKHQLKEERKRLLREARQEAQNILRKAHRKVDNALKELKRTSQSNGSADLEGLDRARRGLQDKRRKLQEGTAAMAPSADRPARWDDLAVGQAIWVLPFEATGQITALHPNKKRLTARIGALEVELGMKQIALASGQPALEPPAPPRTTPIQGPREPLPSELNLIGMRVEPALHELEYYLEQAGLTATPQIRIVHGYGTGRLRKAVGEFLHTHPMVASFHHPPQEQGGQAITIAVLK